MKVRDLNSLMELLGGLAVLIGLIFVGFELQQNTKAVQAGTPTWKDHRGALTERFVDFVEQCWQEGGARDTR